MAPIFNKSYNASKLFEIIERYIGVQPFSFWLLISDIDLQYNNAEEGFLLSSGQVLYFKVDSLLALLGVILEFISWDISFFML